jgi:hypothetical protein
MRTAALLTVAGVAGGIVALGQVNVGASDDLGEAVPRERDRAAGDGSPQAGEIGPDVIVWEIYGYNNYGPEDGYRAYSIGTESCNIGDEELLWISSTNEHPVIAQNMFRLKDGRFEHIGQSWLKHGFLAVNGNQCGECQDTSFDRLGIFCSDPYGPSLNGNQSSAGPKWEVNAWNGVFEYPPDDPPYSGQTARRLRVALADVEAASNPGAAYWVEAQYVTQDDADAGNHLNNASYRKVDLSSSGAISGYDGSTVQQTPAIFAWLSADDQVFNNKVEVPDEGTFYVASRAYDNGDGTWDYEYAVQNLNSDRSGGGFAIDVPSGVNVTNLGFHDVDYHSGEPWDGTDWASAVNATEVSWSTDAYADNPNANALRWGTLYNFRFTADAPPVTGNGRLDLFKPGSPASVDFAAIVPEGAPCDADIDGSGVVDTDDLLELLAAWGSGSGPADLNNSGNVDVMDLLLLLEDWGCGS